MDSMMAATLESEKQPLPPPQPLLAATAVESVEAAMCAATTAGPGSFASRSFAANFILHANALMNLQKHHAKQQQQMLDEQHQQQQHCRRCRFSFVTPTKRTQFQTTSEEERHVEYCIAPLTHINYSDMHFDVTELWTQTEMSSMLQALMIITRPDATVPRIEILPRSRVVLLSTLLATVVNYTRCSTVDSVVSIFNMLEIDHTAMSYARCVMRLKQKLKKMTRKAMTNHLFYIFFFNCFSMHMNKWY
jgi:hypothetical protein